jgi:hypothetical protein
MMIIIIIIINLREGLQAATVYNRLELKIQNKYKLNYKRQNTNRLYK